MPADSIDSHMAGLVIAADRSGAGKTTFTLALLAALQARGLVVQSFKVGPDRIDPGLHSLITGRTAYTLDAFLCGYDGCLTAVHHAQEAVRAEKGSPPDALIVEGVMGLFDGASGTDEFCSTAQIAKWLSLPVLLIVDARSLSRSIVAVVKGYTGLDPKVRFAGVICNNVGSERHATLLKEALATYCPDIPMLGCLPRCNGVTLPSRHLGLVAPESAGYAHQLFNQLVDWIESSCDVAAISSFFQKEQEKVCRDRPDASMNEIVSRRPRTDSPVAQSVTVAVAQDAAFCLLYPELLEALKQAGATLAYFSPLHDKALPAQADGVLLGGGYPELCARELADNTRMRDSIRSFIARQKPVWSEGGGFMYLMEALTDLEGVKYPMAGIFPLHAVMQPSLQSLGYREVQLIKDSEWGMAGTTVRGHEFHYSVFWPTHIPWPFADTKRLTEQQWHNGILAAVPQGLESLGITIKGICSDAHGMPKVTSVYGLHDFPCVTGSYVHLFCPVGSNVPIAFVDACKRTSSH